MKIYFTASLRGKKRFDRNYRKIVSVLETTGCDVDSEQILENDPEKGAFKGREDAIRIYRKLNQMIKQADVIVAEVSHQSVSVGHEISLALENGKPVIALYSIDKAPSLLAGNPNELLQVIKYNMEDLEKVVKKAILKAAEKADVRFNFFVTPKILAYLDWLSQKKRIPRAVYLRNLIEKDMKYSKDYQKEG
ncbi:MAG: nucleoside 2-deoxyribosyltransferase [Patescibacteria group bacterium]|nr:nucleoside 2-deoxyribosyltransferase [Patescibacteria group bacterium]